MLYNIKEKSCIFIATLAVVMTSFFMSCKEEKKDIVDFAFDPYTIPMMHTDSVDMAISSDSGYIRYRLITKVWDVYDTPKDPYWYFPEKAYFEQYDTLGNVVATVNADTVWNFSRKKLWKLKGNVVVKNIEGVIFKTDEVFWDQRTHRVHSDKFVEVDQPDKGLLRATRGFESNEQMTEYTFYGLTDSKILVNEKENQKEIEDEEIE